MLEEGNDCRAGFVIVATGLKRVIVATGLKQCLTDEGGAESLDTKKVEKLFLSLA